MGYTHYWHRPLVLDPRTFQAFVKDVAQLIAHAPTHSSSAGGYYLDKPLRIKGPHGVGAPMLTNDLIAFNGDKLGDLWHESLVIERVMEPGSWQEPDKNGNYFTCCKTARKPYDLIVGAVLITFRFCFPEATVSSDGCPADWTEALAYYRQVFPDRPVPLRGPWHRLETEEETA